MRLARFMLAGGVAAVLAASPAALAATVTSEAIADITDPKFDDDSDFATAMFPSAGGPTVATAEADAGDFETSFGASAFASADAENGVFEGFASVDGLAARFNRPGDQSASGRTTWSDTFVNTSGQASAVEFAFHFAGGELLVDAYDLGSGNAIDTGFRIEVRVNGSVVLASETVLTWANDASGLGFDFSSGILDGTDTQRSLDGPDGSYFVIDAFDGLVSLGVLGAGESVEVEYILEAFARYDEDRFAFVNPGGAGSSGASASFSDPVEIRAAEIRFAQAAPEPTGIALAALAGLALLGARRRRS